MHLSIPCSVILLASSSILPVLGFTARPYKPPGKHDARSPCPGLNAFANHGYMAHSGKGLSISDIVEGAHAAINIDRESITGIATTGFQAFNLSTDARIDLDLLNIHGPIEQDASMRSADTFFGDNHHFNATAWKQTSSHFQGRYATPEALALGHDVRVADSRSTNPEFTYGLKQYEGAYGTMALILSSVGNPVTGKAPIKFLNIYASQDRLPFELGWHPPKQEWGFSTLGPLSQKMMEASGEVPPAAIEVAMGISVHGP